MYILVCCLGEAASLGIKQYIKSSLRSIHVYGSMCILLYKK